MNNITSFIIMGSFYFTQVSLPNSEHRLVGFTALVQTKSV